MISHEWHEWNERDCDSDAARKKAATKNTNEVEVDAGPAPRHYEGGESAGYVFIRPSPFHWNACRSIRNTQL
jgi:hypothetical protein